MWDDENKEYIPYIDIKSKTIELLIFPGFMNYNNL